ncbi:MAG TPA: HIT family protein [Thiobacillus sp.]|nr:HIT family protein [Thiobacillus sp.]
MSCLLCDEPGGTVLWQDEFCRVVRADEPDYPGFLRVILNAHVKEMTDLPAAGQQALMQGVLAAEAALREVMVPDKINLASLGNVVPHLHWHVIPRFKDDPHFPNPVWGAKQRGTPHAAPADLDAQLAAALHSLLGVGRGSKNAEASRTTLSRRLARVRETE